MAKKPTHIPLDILLNGRKLGQLGREVSGAIEFQYDQSWLEWQHTFPARRAVALA